MSFVVPSLGTSRYLSDCLESAAASEGVRGEVVLVHPASVALTLEPIPGLEILNTQAEVGFCMACNLGIAKCESEFIAILNDDAIVEPAWASRLIAALAAAPRAAAAQGVNIQMASPGWMDGRGLEFNRSWQAVQIGLGDLPPASSEPAEEIFGVSATAAIYRRSALDCVASSDSEVFDVGLESYYEDVDLACRLRAAGFSALSVPAARALHAGAATTESRPLHRYSLIYGNRYLVLARARGRDFWSSLPILLGRDLLDLGRAVLSMDSQKSLGIMSGWVRAGRKLRSFAHRGDPTVRNNESQVARES
ncbi:MAG: glycosyltransferase [Thermoanaerobaculia bacterium]